MRRGAFSVAGGYDRAVSSAVPKEAATVVLIREGPPGLECFLVRRHKASGFMAGAFVFPGGKLDPEDMSAAMLARVQPSERARHAQRLEPTPGQALPPERAVGLAVATLRELFEEAGVLLARPVGADELVRGDGVPVWRRELLAGAVAFGALLEREGLELALDHLEYWDHWITPSAEPRRFDTRFFVARMPEGQSAEIDDAETTDSRWLDPEAALAAHRAGSLFLPPPTERTLEGLLGLRSFEALTRAAAARVVAPILPKLHLEEGGASIVMPWDPDYAGLPGEGLPLDAERVTAARLGSRIPVGARFLERV